QNLERAIEAVVREHELERVVHAGDEAAYRLAMLLESRARRHVNCPPELMNSPGFSTTAFSCWLSRIFAVSMLTAYPAIRPCSTRLKTPGVRPTTCRRTLSRSTPAAARKRSSSSSLEPPADGMPIILPTKCSGSRSGSD